MKQIGYIGGKPLNDPLSFQLIEQTTPTPQGRDILVSIKAVSVNPVDTKVRARTTDPQQPPKVLGWDAAGVVEAVGSDVVMFKPGDKVFYAGDITRPGSNATHQLVDERIVGHMPKTLSFEQAAALPLTSITAWEALFSRLKIRSVLDSSKRILILGAAGGVGSIAIQLAKQVGRLDVIATASRDESRQWCLDMGADHVIDHNQDLLAQYQRLGIADPDYILCLTNTDPYFETLAKLIAPQGMICAIVDAKTNDLSLLKNKSAGFVWEFMFTRPMFKTQDMIQQHKLLCTVANLVDEGTLRTTLNTVLGALTPDNLREAHKRLETGHSLGKLVLTRMV
jgi:zinc-binding alcohol dehydrogenase family protein